MVRATRTFARPLPVDSWTVRRTLVWTVVVLTALLLQSTVFARIQLGGTKPDLVYLVTIVLAFLEGPSSGAIAGFFGGMAEDFLLNQPKGITALTLTLVAYAVGMMRTYVVSPSPLLPVALVGGATTVAVVFLGIVRFLLGQPVGSVGFLVSVALLTGVYNAVLTPILFPVVRRAVEVTRTKKALRW